MGYETCTYCQGSGSIQRDGPMPWSSRKGACPLCDGSGRGQTRARTDSVPLRDIGRRLRGLAYGPKGRMALMGLFAGAVVLSMLEFLA